jgi:hypothetical protein
MENTEQTLAPAAPAPRCPDQCFSFRSEQDGEGFYRYATVYADQFSPYELALYVQHLLDQGLRLEDGDDYHRLDAAETEARATKLAGYAIDGDYAELEDEE